MYSLYRVENILNGKFYIGMTKHSPQRRFTEHKSHAKKNVNNGHFYRAIRKHGSGAFRVVLLFQVDTWEAAKSEEIRLISELKPHYNSTTGGDGAPGHLVSAETRAMFSRIHRGNTYCLGRKQSEETKKLLRDIGLSQKNEWAKRSHLGPKASSKAVVCLNDGRQFSSASAAAREFGLSKSIVIEICLRDPRRLMADKKVFRYLGDHFGGLEEVAQIRQKYREAKLSSSEKLMKKVKCENDGVVYANAVLAAGAYGISRCSVQEICLGKKSSKAGLLFSYCV